MSARPVGVAVVGLGYWGPNLVRNFYEVEHFAPHHFERFAVQQGITGLWQVTARAHATFGEALDMDVSYARNWSLGLDLWLLLRTPLHVLRRKGTR